MFFLLSNCVPLSNPTSRVEATPQDLLEWTDGQAIVATGSPFDPVQVGERSISIAQCNNSYIFPGLGLGIIASGANRVTDQMLMTASATLASFSPLVQKGYGPLLPPLSELSAVSAEIAFEVGRCAQEEGIAPAGSEKALKKSIQGQFWNASYRPYRRIPIPF